MNIGRYEIIEKIGKGAFGVVWKGRDPVLDRYAAIKVMSDAQVGDRDLVERFTREARTAGQMQHVNIVTIYDLGEHDGRPFIAMEFLEGTDLDAVIKQKRQLTTDKKIDIIKQVAAGLHYAHQRGIIHRDVKPANIRILDDGTAKIMDFGIARIASSDMTRTGQFMGTVNYMSPEQIKARSVDSRSDLFALGVVFYELVSHRRPFPGDSITAVIYKIINETPPSLVELEGTEYEFLEGIINRILDKDPMKRYQNGLEIVHALESRLSLTATLKGTEARTEETINLSRRHADIGDFNTAINLIDQMLNKEPENESIKKARGEIIVEKQMKDARGMVEEGRLEEARQVLEQSATLIPGHPGVTLLAQDVDSRLRRVRIEKLMAQGERLMNEKRFAQAVETYGELLKVDPYNSEGKEKLDQARGEQRAIEIGDLIERAKADLGVGKFQEAMDQTSSALSLDPHHREAKRLVTEIETSKTLIERRNKVEELLAKGRTAARHKSFEEAIGAFDAAVKADPQNETARSLLSGARADEEKHREEAEISRLVAQGKQHLSQRQFEPARQALLKAQRMAPGHPEIPALLAAAAHKKTTVDAGARKGVPVAAVAGGIGALLLIVVAVAAVIFLRSSPAEKAFAKAEKLAAAGDLKGAYAQYDEVFKLEPSPKVEKRAQRSLIALAPRLEGGGLLAEARDIYLKTLRQWVPDDKDALARVKGLGAKFMAAGRLEDADEMYKDVRKLDPSDYAAMGGYYEVGKLLEDRGRNALDVEKRISDLQRSRAIFDQLADIGVGKDSSERSDKIRAELFTLEDQRDRIKELGQAVAAAMKDAETKAQKAENYPEAIRGYARAVELINNADPEIQGNFAGVMAKASAEAARLGGAQEEFEKTRTAAEQARSRLTSAEGLAKDGDLQGALRMLAEVRTIAGAGADAVEEAGRRTEALQVKLRDRDEKLAEARTLYARGDMAGSRALASQLLADFPKDIEIQALLRESDERLKKDRAGQEIDQAIAAAEALEASSPDQAQGRYTEILSKYERDLNPAHRSRIDEARTRINRGKLSDEIAVQKGQAEKMIVAGQYEDALRVLRSLQKKIPGDKELAARIKEIQGLEDVKSVKRLEENARAFLQQGKYVEAAKAAGEILQMRPDNAAAQEIRRTAAQKAADQLVREGRDSLARGNLDLAQKAARDAESILPTSQAAQQLLKEIEQARAGSNESAKIARAMEEAFAAKNWSAVQQHARSVLAADPGNERARQLERTAGEELAKIQGELDTAGKAAALAKRAGEAFSSGDLASAEDLARQTLALDAQNQAAASLLRDIEKRKAEEQARARIKERSESVRAAASSGDYVGAAKTLSGVLAEAGAGGTDDLAAVIFHNASIQLARSKDCAGARDFAARATGFASPSVSSDMKRWSDAIGKQSNCGDIIFQSFTKAQKYLPLP